MHFDSPSMGRGIMVNIFLTCVVNELVTMTYFILLFRYSTCFLWNQWCKKWCIFFSQSEVGGQLMLKLYCGENPFYWSATSWWDFFSLTFRLSYKIYMIKCFRSGIPNAMPTNLCQVRKMCSFLVIADGFLSSIVRKAREALHLHPLILVLIGENCNKRNYLPLFRFILPSSRPSVMACSVWTPQMCHISSIHKYNVHVTYECSSSFC